MTYRDETARLHAIARAQGSRLMVTHHTEEQMAERDVTRFEVERVLRAGFVVMIETDPRGRERWRGMTRMAGGSSQSWRSSLPAWRSWSL
jgi:hypothetical protein